MLSYNDMIMCGQKYDFNKKLMLVEKYKAFIKYLKNIIIITFRDYERQVVSYLKETESCSFLLDWCDSGIHYDGFVINTQGKTIDVKSLKAHDSYYDPELDLTSDIKDDNILSFFDREYKQFVKLFVPNYYFERSVDQDLLVDEKHSLVCKIANKFNEVCFDHFKTNFSLLGIDDLSSFINSKFSLSFTDEKRKELDKEVYETYQTFVDKVNELTKKFDNAVKCLK